MTIRYLVLAVATALPSVGFAADYRPGWTSVAMLEQVNACRSAVVLPAIDAYVKKGRTAGQPEEAVRNESISMLPVFESMASTLCYCALNELAKDIALESFNADRAKMRGYLEGVKCKSAVADRMRALKEQTTDLRLK